MKLDEFKIHYKKFHLLWREEEVARLSRFSEIMKKSPVESAKYLLVSGDCIGFTDSYRAVIISATNVVQKTQSPLGYYSPDLLSLLKKAQEVALLEDYTLAIRVKEEVHVFAPVLNQVPDIARLDKLIPADAERISFFTDIFKEMPLTDVLSWEAICTTFKPLGLHVMCPRFYFTPEGISVKADLGKSRLEMMFPIPLEMECEKVLNPNFIDLWLKATAKEKVVATLLYTSKESSAVCFEMPNLKYIIMPISWRKGGK
ncbi:hypothetical protein EGX98_04910 [Fusobacterium necrophorum]|uniref:Uncharacterized protein n=1 Tax=Fusobacterium necrophorum BL TaxID=1441732 RepID=A0AB73BX20_9FUSO|nr:hypothetical protein [Fusobacterium necrophorum]AYZ73435.1 hypothetical protein EGX98_04910 [Fusobacterium necrophorum]AZW08568.1 hypothetical protein EO219_02515 [Fusobacterium necrophorum subsp. necrophorum]KDE63794.1 hypothetical protein FUSO3_04500 [Fusobacterium necrophorum BL]KDE74614.1 hypothetical protein FUSO7_01975 [Fusobacterium necrophorum BFTR-2]SDB41107.1 hypothetical protein SAMN02983009_01969 [Fusobacterium necrophorum]